MGKFIDLIGQRFGRLVILKRAYVKNKRIFWECDCDCGENTFVPGHDLKSGHTKSCGCLLKETVTYANPNTRHSYRYHPLYKTLMDMKARCYNPKNSHYYLYGGKGIKICDEWHSPKNFIEWGINNGWSKDMTIDRIDSNKDYCPENCQWLSKSQHSAKTNRERCRKNAKS